jgi:hypothetical protein
MEKHSDIEGKSQSGERCEMRTEFWPENVKGKDYLEDLGIDGSII